MSFDTARSGHTAYDVGIGNGKVSFGNLPVHIYDKAYFCNPACQKAAWKSVHKAKCRAQPGLDTTCAPVPDYSSTAPAAAETLCCKHGDHAAHAGAAPAAPVAAPAAHAMPSAHAAPAVAATGSSICAQVADVPGAVATANGPTVITANCDHCPPTVSKPPVANGHGASHETLLPTSSPPKPTSPSSALSQSLQARTRASPLPNGHSSTAAAATGPATGTHTRSHASTNGAGTCAEATGSTAMALSPDADAGTATKATPRPVDQVPELSPVPEQVRPHVRVLRYFRPTGPLEKGYGEAVPVPTVGADDGSTGGEEKGSTTGLEVSRRVPLRVPDCTVYLLGTGHVSKSSCADVLAIIEAVRPQTVFFELCRSRAGILDPNQVAKVPTMAELWAGLKSGQQTPFGVLYAWFLAKVADSVEVFPGEEFRVGWRAAQSVQAAVCLGDRPVAVTVRRVWASLSLWEKAKLLANIITGGLSLPDKATLSKMIEDVKDDHDALLAELTRAFPSLITPLVKERDLYMSCYLQKLAALPRNKAVVAIVGKGHLKGISDSFGLDIDVKPLMETPGSTATRSKLTRLSSYGSYALLFCGAAYVCVSVYSRSRAASQ
eukprot:jgi/Mesvir1/17615/Mv08841-RA.1